MAQISAPPPYPGITATEHDVLTAQTELARWAAKLTMAEVPDLVQQRLKLVIFDALGVTTVGGRLPERAALTDAWAPPQGVCPLFGTGITTTPETAAWLNATAMVSLELDEGNKFAAGHPAAHAFPAVLALASYCDADGPTTAAALLVAYEVAARFGRATQLNTGMHPHGNWGLAGAGAGCARLLGLSAEKVNAAIDTAVGMPIAGSFSAATGGNPVRNEWVGASNVAGLAAARLAASGIATATGIAAHSLGGILGSFDPTELTNDLGSRWDVDLGYFKQHSSCAFTHPAADAILKSRQRLGITSSDHTTIDSIEVIDVETYGMAAKLEATSWSNRLSAMFSIPYVIATALLSGRVHPSGFDAESLASDELARIARKVQVHSTSEFDAGLPDHRGARVTITFTSGQQLSETVRDPIGDAAFHPLDESDISALIANLLAETKTDHAETIRIRRAATELLTTSSARSTLASIDCR